MDDLTIAQWIKEINEEIHKTEHLIVPLRHLGRHEWAEQLAGDVKIMQEAMAVLQRIGQNKGKRASHPPLWLRSISEPDDPAKKRRRRSKPQP